MMIKSDKYIKNTIETILKEGVWDKNPRPKWEDGSPAHSRFITQQVFSYNIDKGEFPVTTLRPTALKAAFHDIEAIYIKQTNVIEEMHPSIYFWWKPFSQLKRFNKYEEYHTIGQTYGNTVQRYELMDNLLHELENNPFSRRHIMNLWDNKQMEEDSNALVPCAFQTLWGVREKEECIRYLDVTLIQRSQDFVMTASINPAQYTMLAMMVAGHLTQTTDIEYKVGKFLHIVQNCHIYDRHISAAEELLEKEPKKEQPKIILKNNKNFFSYKADDFEFVIPPEITPLSMKLQLAI